MEYNFIGWYKEDNHDKVWVCVQLDGDRWRGNFATVWGRRGKKLQHKVFSNTSAYEMEKLVNSKHKKGYSKIIKEQLDEVYPEFQNDLEATALWAMLKV